jgi:S-adenosylmethionine:tRNA-ribosyltransferase-isomerase (queuine synthetase)
LYFDISEHKNAAYPHKKREHSRMLYYPVSSFKEVQKDRLILPLTADR